MLSVLIADDEMAICFLLKKLIHWDELGLSLLGTACSGAEAYRMAAELQPDILITDIQMPVMNGLELIEKVREEQPGTSFVIVSGYQEFEYAKQAIRFGVEDYLLKPIKESELNAILLRIQKKKLESSEIAAFREEKEKVRKVWLRNILDGEKENVEAGRQYFDLGAGGFCLIQFAVGTEGDLFADRENALVAEQIQKGFSDAFQQYFPDMEFVLDPEGKLTFFVSGMEEGERMGRQYSDFLNREKVKYSNRKITMAVSRVSGTLEELPAIARQIKRLMRGRAWVDQGEPLLPEHFAVSGDAGTAAFEERRRVELMRLLDSREEWEAWNWLQALLDVEQKKGASYPWSLFELLEVLACRMEECLRELELWDESTELLILRWKRRPAFCGSYGKLLCEVRKLLQAIYEVRDKKRREMEGRPVRLAKAYVAEHYHEAVTMEDVAAWTGLNSAYFSSLFKKSEGINFTEYLTRIRLGKAKAYLAETSLSLAEVAAKVGYTDAKYFSKVFIKNVGIRPAEYRKIHS